MASEKRVTFAGFSAGALAACGAVTFTNPWEVVKTRLQLQGELLKKNANLKLPYKSAVHAFGVIARTEGLKGLQKGLAPAYVYQCILNGTRLGLYEPLKLALDETLPFEMVNMIVSGATSGIMGAFFSSPLFLIKTRMQSLTTGILSTVGHQHSYVNQGTVKALKTVYENEGIRGLWRGVDAAMVRTGVGSAIQLSSYDLSKRFLLSTGLFDLNEGAGKIEVHFGASLITSFFVCLAMNPFDVASTRMYNQKVSADGKTGSLYKNGLDCIMKTVRAEGLSALYKGFSAHYLRIGPHTILTFVFLEQLKSFFRNYNESSS